MTKLIGPAALPYLDPSPAERTWPSRAAALAEQATATDVVLREYGSTRRLLVGAASVVLLAIAVTAAGLTVAVAMDAGVSAVEALLVGGVGLAVTAAAAAPGWRLGRPVLTAGSRVVEALAAWHRLPESVDHDGNFVPPEHRQHSDAVSPADRRRINTRDAVSARTYVFSAPLFTRMAVAGLLIVAVLSMWGIAISGAVQGGDAVAYVLAATAVGIGVVLMVPLVALLSGAYRVNAAHARRDPISRRLRRVFST